MASLTQDRDTPQLGSAPTPVKIGIGVEANTLIYKGVMVGVDASGWLVDGAAAGAVLIAGCSAQRTDNTTGNLFGNSGLANGVVSNVFQGVFKFNNGTGADVIAQANVGQPCYVVDNQTVGLTGANARLYAGTIMQVDSDGIWVEMGLIMGSNPQQSAYPVVTLAVSIDLTEMANATIWTFTPLKTLRILKASLSTSKAATGAGATATLTPNIGGVPLTGGVLTPTLANQTQGAELAGTAITGANHCPGGTAITIVASAVTAFTAGEGTLYLQCG
jgi:hypothetical protein